MREEFLYYLWKYGLYMGSLKLITGDSVEVLSPGEHYQASGSSFFNAKIRIKDAIWVGNIELHLKSSDWVKYNHTKDKACNNVILHVVAENDMEIKRLNGKVLPTIEMICPPSLLEHYMFLMQNKDAISCQSHINKVARFTISQFKEALLVERLEQKSKIIEKRFLSLNSDWEETFYQTLASNFGFKINAVPFELLAKSLPFNYLGKHKNELQLIEAMLLGQAGLLPEKPRSKYEQGLVADYKHLQAKFKLIPLSSSLWKFVHLRPANSPIIRIAQFAALIHQSTSLFSKIIEASSINDVELLFRVQASAYWDTHYNYNKESLSQVKKLGKTAFNNILINTISPILFLYGKQKHSPKLVDKALDLLTKIPAENNSITNKWLELNIDMESAFDSQALIQLKNVYCKKKRCLSCRIGTQVVKQIF